MDIWGCDCPVTIKESDQRIEGLADLHDLDDWDGLAVYIDVGLLFMKWFSWGGKCVELLEQDASPCLLKGARVSFYYLPPSL